MKKILLCCSFLLPLSLQADALTDDLRDSSLANVNALIILTTQDMLTSGKYTFSDGGTIKIYNIPTYYHFNPFVNNFNFFVNGSLGYSVLNNKIDFQADIPDPRYRPADDIEYETIAVRLGGGVRYVSSIDIYALVGFDYIYSSIKNSYDYNSPGSQEDLRPIFEAAFANQKSHAYTYELFWKIGYAPSWAEWKPYVELQVNYFDTKSDLSTSELLSFRSTSGGSRLKVGFETPQFINVGKTGLSLEFYISGNAFIGDVKETLGFDGYGSSAALMHLYFHKGFYGEVDDMLYHAPSLLDRIDLMVESVEGNGISGYNIGLSAGFDF